jgi:hypothetical protein
MRSALYPKDKVARGSFEGGEFPSLLSSREVTYIVGRMNPSKEKCAPSIEDT